MSKLYPQKIAIFVPLLLVVMLAGCSHHKTNRGHLLRGDWAVEYNRTPWIGTSHDDCEPPYQNVSEEPQNRKTLFGCLKKESNDKKHRGLRRHCGMNQECTPQNPCCRTLGCGMWVDPDDPAMPSSHGGVTRACGLTPFCFPEKPCGLTLSCGKPVNGNGNVNGNVSVNVNPQTLMLPNAQALNGLGGLGGGTGRNPGIGNAQGMAPGTVVLPNGTVVHGMAANNMTTMRGMNPNGAAGAVPGTLVSRGIVPGASAITSGGMVAAIGVATPARGPTGVP